MAIICSGMSAAILDTSVSGISHSELFFSFDLYLRSWPFLVYQKLTTMYFSNVLFTDNFFIELLTPFYLIMTFYSISKYQLYVLNL